MLARYTTATISLGQRVPRGLLSSMLMAAAVFCMPRQANAEQVIATVTGIVTYGIDGQAGTKGSGVFGLAPGTPLTNLPVTVVYSLDTTGGVPYFSNPTQCINGQTSLGTNTPVPKAKITINGQTYNLGSSTAPSPDIASFVTSSGAPPAEKQQTSLVFQFSDNGSASNDKAERLYVGIYLNSLHVCRNWADPLNYTLQLSDLSTGGFTAVVPGQTPGTPAQYSYADFDVQTVTVSGPMTADCLSAVSGAVRVAVGPGGKSIFAKFTPKGGLEAAESACGVSFNWQQYIEALPGDSPYYPIDPQLPVNDQLGPGDTTLITTGGASLTFKGTPLCPTATHTPNTRCSPYTAPPRFLDPQSGGYLVANVDAKAFVADTTDAFPLYLNTGQLKTNTLPNGLCFSDKPFDPFLPSNKFVTFTTLLVGVDPKTPKVVSNYYASWRWDSNNIDNADPAGGVTLLSLPQGPLTDFGCPEFSGGD